MQEITGCISSSTDWAEMRSITDVERAGKRTREHHYPCMIYTKFIGMMKAYPIGLRYPAYDDVSSFRSNKPNRFNRPPSPKDHNLSSIKRHVNCKI